MNNNLFNMVATLKNGQFVKKAYVTHQKSPSCESVLNILWDEGFILGYQIFKKNTNTLKVFLKYKNEEPGINSIKVISKPSLRVYYSVEQLWKLKLNDGVLIISTNKGFMSLSECKRKKIGGEPFILIK